MDNLRKKFYGIFQRLRKRRHKVRRQGATPVVEAASGWRSSWMSFGVATWSERASRKKVDANSTSFAPLDSVPQSPLASRVVEPGGKGTGVSLRDIQLIVVGLSRQVVRRMRPALVLLMICAFGAGIGISNWLKRHPLKHVVFESDFVHVRPENLTPRLAGLLEDSLFELDLVAIQQELIQVPWVASVSLRRMWPDSLQVNITEKKVRAKWGKHGFISDEGVIFSAPLTPAAAAFSAYLPELMGSEDDVQNLLDYYEQMSVALAPTGLDIVALTRGSRYWQMTLSNNINVLVNHEGALNKLIKFRQVYEQLGERQARVASADLRYHHGVAITWRDANSSEDNS